MGSSQHKDSSVDIYLQTSKNLYLAGEWVEGIVYINSKQQTSYSSLSLKLQCWQEIFWTQHYDKTTRCCCNKTCSYSETLWLNNFGHSGVQQGHYSFPFKLLLPQSLSGSFKKDGRNYIGYSLTAELSAASVAGQRLYPQTWAIPLNIDESLRMPFGPVSQNKMNSPKCCCSCCVSYGTVQVSLSCDKNAIRPGDSIKVRAQIDNSFGTKSITDIAFNLKRTVTLVASGLNQKNITEDMFQLYSSQKQVLPGNKELIEFEGSVPLDFCDKSTAIGTIISNYFTLCLASEMGCCSEAADSQVHLVYHSNSRSLEPVKPFTLPSKWNPIVAKEMVLNNLKPYIYKPQGTFAWYNRAVHPNDMGSGNFDQMSKIESMFSNPNTPHKYAY